MATGEGGSVDLAATTNTLVYTVPADKIATVNINVCNRNAGPILIRIARLNGGLGTLANEDYIEYDFPIPANGVLERTGILLAATYTIVAYSDTANVSVQVWPWEEAV